MLNYMSTVDLFYNVESKECCDFDDDYFLATPFLDIITKSLFC